ncbi:MAG: hypothetical protein ACE5EL_00150, partial [Anaerolineae bacterium]
MRRAALAAVLVTATVWSVTAAAPATARGPGQRACQAEANQVVSPDTVALGGRVTITLTLQADCSAVQVPLHVALVFDNSVAMAGTRMNYMKLAVRAFVDALDFTVARVGLAR